MWFQFAKGEDALSVDRQLFKTEYKNGNGESFFRAPAHFRDKLVIEGGCKALTLPPAGAPDNLPELSIPDPQIAANNEAILAMKAELSSEKTVSSALRAELSAVLHERDGLKLQVHELTESMNELKARMEDEGVEEE